MGISVFPLLCALLGMGAAQWATLSAVPDALGEVAAAQVNGIVYLVGQQTAKTYAYTIATDTWVSNLAQRPLSGNHHAMVSPGDGTLWLVGGFGGGSQGKVRLLYFLRI